MDVLCTDKTGTITLNQLSVGQLKPSPPFSEDELLTYGAIASAAASQDPLDLAILTAHAEHHLAALPARLSFTPFNPALKRTEATVLHQGTIIRVLKGAPRVVASLVVGVDWEALERDVDMLAASGYRVLAVAAGPEHGLRLVGL